MKEISDKLERMEKKYGDLEERLDEKDNENRCLGKDMDRKIEAFESKIATLGQCIQEKNDAIALLQKRLDDLENKPTTKTIVEKKKKKVSCTKCDYTSSSEQGLRIHSARKHTVNKEESSNVCELCDKKFDTVKILRNHMKSHSYQDAKYKCVDCDFVGTNDMTMDVHTGKYHTDIFECGICEFIAESEEGLEIHLFTCEIYHCNGQYGSFPNSVACTVKSKNISDMKRHLEKEHDENATIKHRKISKNNPEEVDCKYYYLDQL